MTEQSLEDGLSYLDYLNVQRLLGDGPGWQELGMGHCTSGADQLCWFQSGEPGIWTWVPACLPQVMLVVTLLAPRFTPPCPPTPTKAKPPADKTLLTLLSPSTHPPSPAL
jgi:hypothetical protein